MSTQMLKAVAEALPDLGIHSFIIKEKQATLLAYKKVVNGRSWEYAFTAHPGEKCVEIRLRDLDPDAAENKVYPIARVSLSAVTDLPKTLEESLLKLSKLYSDSITN